MLITNQMIQIHCFQAICSNQILKSSSLLKQQCCNFVRKRIKTHWKKTNSLTYSTQKSSNFMNHCHWKHLSYTDILELLIFRMNWNHYVMVLPKKLIILRKSSRKKFWNKKEKVFTLIKIIWFHFILHNLCTFFTSSFAKNKGLIHFMILIQQTWYKNIFILHTRCWISTSFVRITKQVKLINLN